MIGRPRVVLATVESDSHTWNLIYLELLLREVDTDVINMGACTPANALVDIIRWTRPDLVVISTVNGHGCSQAKSLIQLCERAHDRRRPPFVIGGKLSTHAADDAAAARELQAAGFAAVFVGPHAVREFCAWLGGFRRQHCEPADAEVVCEGSP